MPINTARCLWRFWWTRPLYSKEENGRRYCATYMPNRINEKVSLRAIHLPVRGVESLDICHCLLVAYSFLMSACVVGLCSYVALLWFLMFSDIYCLLYYVSPVVFVYVHYICIIIYRGLHIIYYRLWRHTDYMKTFFFGGSGLRKPIKNELNNVSENGAELTMD